MSNLTRWEPMREMMTLREAMDQLFNDAFTRLAAQAQVESPSSPPLTCTKPRMRSWSKPTCPA